MLYFAYGSNMSSRRLAARIESPSRIGVGCLKEYRFAFHKVSILDSSGKCDACFTGNTADSVWGVIFEIADADMSKLDRFEDRGYGYERQWVHVQCNNGEILAAQTYVAIRTDSALKPLHWYKEHVLRGAREHRLPADYIRFIEGIDAIIDTDAERTSRELSLYDE